MLEDETAREWADLCLSIAGVGFGDGTVELARECGAFDTGEIRFVHSTGSVTLRCIGGRDEYG